MKKILKAAILLGLFVTSHAHAAFLNAYTVANWTKTVNGGSINTRGAPNTIVLTSSNNGGGTKNQDFTIAAIANSAISFQWSYTTKDKDGSTYDPFGVLLNGIFTKLSANGLKTAQSGTYSFNVKKGDIFGFRANSLDSIYGAAKTTVSNFNATPQVPIPPALWLIGVPLLGLLGKTRKPSAQ